jgi:phenylalanyl-tRNA synthetase beta chain
MNLNISYNWLKEYVKTRKKANEFANLISLAGPSVDKITKSNEGLDGVVVGKITKKEKHPNADKLFVGTVDIGDKTIQIIFGQMAVVNVGDQLPVAVAPTTMPGGEKIIKSKLRGIYSEGMLCLDSELEISQDDKVTFFDSKIKPGTPIIKALKLLDDTIFDIEVTSNRPDAMSIVGIAREAAAILNEKLLYTDPKPNTTIRKKIKLNVSVKEPKLCQRYQAIVMTDVKVEPSPLWMQQRLMSAGLRPINNLVDITNYVLLELGRPMHVFDYDKLVDNEIIVRLAKKGEKILALDEKEYELASNDLIIADGKNPVAVAGIMGGELSSATSKTKTIVLESANFDSTLVRRTSRSLNLRSDSSNLYEKNLSPEGTEAAISRAIELVRELAGGKVASELFDKKDYKYKAKEVILPEGSVEKLLGVKIDNKIIENNLISLGFKVVKKSPLTVRVPWWRDNDIEGAHDLIEEVARIYGYHNLPMELPQGQIPIDFTNSIDAFFWGDRAKDMLAGLGLTEAYNYSFISEKLIKNYLLEVEDHIKIDNPLSSDYEYMRTSLVPGMLQTVSENNNNFDNVNLFELSRIYLKNEGGLPNENNSLTIAISQKEDERAFFELKGMIEVLMTKLNIENWNLMPSDVSGTWQAGQVMQIETDNEIIGHLGMINQNVLRSFGIKRPVAIAEIQFSELEKLAKPESSYQPLSKFPKIELDLSMEIDSSLTYREVVDLISNYDNLIESVSFLSEYHSKQMESGKKSLAVRIAYRDNNKTLTLEDTQKVHTSIVNALTKKYNISIR